MSNVRKRTPRPVLLGLLLAALSSGCSKDAMESADNAQEPTTVVLQLQAGDVAQLRGYLVFELGLVLGPCI
mgnify:CR=1 FL=1